MFRKIILFVATFALACVAFAIYQWRDEGTVRVRPVPRQVPTLQPTNTPISGTTQPAAGQAPALVFRGARLPPGERPVARLYDPDTGEARIIFQASQWEPISDTEFHLLEPSARLLLPGGQLAFVRSDEGHIKVHIDDNGNVNPKSGRFSGHVRIFVDLTDPEWRRQNPDLAEPEQHPQAVVKVWLDDASFDLDLARLQTDGDVLVQSSRGTIEGRGLELAWSEVDRRVKLLRIVEGRRATLQGPGLQEFGTLPGGTQTTATPTADTSTPDASRVPPTDATAQNVNVGVAAALPGTLPRSAKPDPAVDQPGSSFHTSPGATISFVEPKQQLPEDRVDTYQVIFRDNVVARQKDGIKVIGELRADVLTVLADFGREERVAAEHVPGTQPAQTAPATAAQGAPEPMPPGQDDGSTIELLWTGEVLLEPAPSPTTQEAAPDVPKRFHLRADGARVTVRDAQEGAAVCRSLEYHMESKRIWLTGAPDLAVELHSGPDTRITVAQSLFFDYPTGLATLEGAGRMIRGRVARADTDLAAQEQSALRMVLADSPSDMRLAWTEHCELHFARTQPPATEANAEAQAPGQQVNYLKQAVFLGGVDMSTPGQSVAADRVEVVFLPPTSDKTEDQPRERASALPGGLSGDRLMAEHILATGRVRMTQQTHQDGRQAGPRKSDLVTCDRLEVQMTVDEGGRNIPSQGRALGSVVARQTVQEYRGPIPWGPPQVREIRAGEQMVIEMASVPRPVTDTERRRLEAYGRRHGYSPDSPEWQKQVQRLQDRRDVVITQLVARGGVAASDARQNLNDLAGNTLECSFDQAGQMTKALILGSTQRPAYVDHNTFAIRGEQLSLDMTSESVEVPGAGMLRFYNDQDLDGRALAKPIPVVVTWDRQMWLRGKEDVGTFTGNVRVTSENNIMEAQELRLRFAPPPQAETAPAPATGVPRFLAGLLGGTQNRGQHPQEGGLAGRVRKRLGRVDALGDAVILSSAYQEPARQATAVARFVVDLVPEALLAPATQPAPVAETRRLLSRVRMAGPRVRIDLLEEQLLVEGEGNLLVEDYRLPTGGPRREAVTSGFLSGDALPGLDGGGGPSQTLFTWENSMTFLSRNNIAVFDRKVVMRHRAGEEMVLAGQLESALKLDEATRRRIRSRSANLTCDNLRAEFQTDPGRKRQDSSPLSRATSLHGFRAWGNVYLLDRDARTQRTASGTIIAYNRGSGLVEVAGGPSQQAVIEEVDAATGRLNGHWNGDSLEWNLNTGIIQTRRGSILR